VERGKIFMGRAQFEIFYGKIGFYNGATKIFKRWREIFYMSL
jgi:hypothetical protein